MRSYGFIISQVSDIHSGQTMYQYISDRSIRPHAILFKSLVLCVRALSRPDHLCLCVNLTQRTDTETVTQRLHCALECGDLHWLYTLTPAPRACL